MKILLPVHIRMKEAICNWGIFSTMDSWYDIVKSYEDPKNKDPNRKDDGTYSQFSVVMILIYLIFGKDHPYHIAQFFDKLENHQIKHYERGSVLRFPNRIALLLSKMEEDDLLVMHKEKEGRTLKKYELNPKVIQSLFRKGAQFKNDGSSFEIPLDNVEKTLSLLEKSNIDNEVRNRLLSIAIIPNVVNYFTFLMFFETSIINSRARRKNADLKGYSYATSYIRDYIRELKRLPGIISYRGETLILLDPRPLSDFSSNILK